MSIKISVRIRRWQHPNLESFLRSTSFHFRRYSCRVNRWTHRCFQGHSLPITCMALLSPELLVSGSADRSLRVWNLRDNTSVVLKQHTGSIKCIVPLDGTEVPELEGMSCGGFTAFCSGGNDHQICVWNYKGLLLQTIDVRNEEENLHTILAIDTLTLVTASNANLLCVYRLETFKFKKILLAHRESVRCLVKISDSYFASASMDGAIIVWSSETLQTHKILNCPIEFRNTNKVYIYDVKFLLPLSEQYLAAAIGGNILIYDISSGDCLMEAKPAHQAEVNFMSLMYQGTKLVSCSADNTIKLWDVSKLLTPRPRGRNEKPQPLNIAGELFGHTDSVNQVLTVNDTTLVSCSSDKMVLLWKDGRVESDVRTNIIAQSNQPPDLDPKFFTEDFGGWPRESPRTVRRNLNLYLSMDDSPEEDYTDSTDHASG
ncbi:hypothetical protein PROFUN_12612 [Planoprotostelium fungivorum]|uniref:Uncharacterized protein n=1 Tax=Planoprotostelium fungivorum TaxID=1890364 RepID=A0A2P6N731_9EUKA|nr:hypothetical protein PROFUN_12612 [Planoprotostelium fungivorum]